MGHSPTLATLPPEITQKIAELDSKYRSLSEKVGAFDQRITTNTSNITTQLGQNITNFLAQGNTTVMNALSNDLTKNYVTKHEIGYNGDSIDFRGSITAHDLGLSCPGDSSEACLDVAGAARMTSAEEWVEPPPSAPVSGSTALPAPAAAPPAWSIGKGKSGDLVANYLVATGATDFSANDGCLKVLGEHPGASVYMGGLSSGSGADMMAGVCSGGHSTDDRRQFYLSKADAKSGASTYNKIPVTDSAAKFESLTVGDTPSAAEGGVKIQKDLFADKVTGQSSVTSPGTFGAINASSVNSVKISSPSISSSGTVHADQGFFTPSGSFSTTTGYFQSWGTWEKGVKNQFPFRTVQGKIQMSGCDHPNSEGCLKFVGQSAE